MVRSPHTHARLLVVCAIVASLAGTVLAQRPRPRRPAPAPRRPIVRTVVPKVDATVYDLVLAGGRVMDPQTKLDAVRNVGIKDGQVGAISEQPLKGVETIDVKGLVVAPGFIDLHAHGQDLESSRWQALDGVTTALELEAGAFPVAAWYREREGKARINYGASVSHMQARGLNILAKGAVASDSPGVYQRATPEQMTEMERAMRQGLDEGALGLGFGLAYVPGASREEIWRLFKVGAERRVTSFVHLRGAGQIEPASSIESLQEVVADAATTGASLHVVHVTSVGLRQTPELLEMIDGARKRAIDVTTELYPYTAASTDIKAAIFDEGWREKLGADYEDIEWVATGERLTEATFAEHRRTGGMIIAHVIPEGAILAALAHPNVMIASDGVPFVDGRAHPRGAGTFSRVLGRYVRQMNALSLMEALRRMTILPAERLAAAVPQMRNKGRLIVGADADITVFDPARVADRATFAEPAQASDGIAHVIVGGTFVVRDGRLIETTRPGRPIRRAVKAGL